MPKYLKIPSYGGSASPAEILQEVGFDLRSENFWQSGFDVIGRMVAQFRRLQGSERRNIPRACTSA